MRPALSPPVHQAPSECPPPSRRRQSVLLAGVDRGPCADGLTRRCPRPFRMPTAAFTPSQFACYDQIDLADMGTWQVQQDCCQSDGSWWCFEPTHLSKCPKDHLSKSYHRHDMPGEPDAIYRPMRRGGQPGKRLLSKSTNRPVAIEIAIASQVQGDRRDATVSTDYTGPRKPSPAPSNSPLQACTSQDHRSPNSVALVALAEMASAAVESSPAGQGDNTDHTGQASPSLPLETQRSTASAVLLSTPPRPNDLVTGPDGIELAIRSSATPEHTPEPTPEPTSKAAAVHTPVPESMPLEVHIGAP